MGIRTGRSPETNQGGPTKTVPDRKKVAGTQKTILHIVGDGSLSGLPRHVLELCLGLRASAYHCVIIAPAGPLLDIAKDASIEIKALELRQGSWSVIRALRQVFREYLAKKKPLIVHVHGARASWVGRAAAFGLNIPLVCTEYQWTADTHPVNQFTGFFELLAMNFFDSVTTKTIATSQAVADFLLERGITRAEKLVVIYNGVPGLHPFHHRTSPTVHLGTVGTLQEGRGFEDLLMALKLVTAKNKNVHLDIVGGGLGLDALLALVKKLKLQEYVDFYAFSFDLSPAFHRWDIYVHPHRHDSYGQALLEAMGAGVAVVGTKVGATKEVVNHNVTGLLVPASDPPALAQALKQLIENRPLRLQLGTEGSRRIAAGFMLSRMTEQTKQVYGAV